MRRPSYPAPPERQAVPLDQRVRKELVGILEALFCPWCFAQPCHPWLLGGELRCGVCLDQSPIIGNPADLVCAQEQLEEMACVTAQKLPAGPGDLVVVRVPDRVPAAFLSRLGQQTRETLDAAGIKAAILVVTSECAIEVLPEAELAVAGLQRTSAPLVPALGRPAPANALPPRPPDPRSCLRCDFPREVGENCAAHAPPKPEEPR